MEAKIIATITIFAMEIDIPDDAFKKAEKVVAKLNLETEDVRINEVKVIKGKI